MSATGPNTETADPVDLLTSTTSPLQTAGGSDVAMSSLFTAGVAHRVFCCASGSLAIKRVHDTAFTVYAVQAGLYIDGHIIAVGGTGNGTSVGLTYICEV